MVNYSAAGVILRPNFNRFYPSLFSKTGWGRGTKPLVLGYGIKIERLGLNHEVRRAPHLIFQTPHQGIIKIQRRWHLTGVTLWRSLIYPGQNRCALFITEATIISKVLNTHLRINMPGRHDAILYPKTNYQCKQLGLFIA